MRARRSAGAGWPTRRSSPATAWDDRLALTYAEDLAQHAPAAPAWARQMRIVLLQELGERDQAIRLLAELLAGDAVRDRAERRFLLARLRELAPHHPLLFEDPT